MVALNNTSTEALLRRAAYWRSRGLSWKQVGEKMNANPEELEELSQIHDKRYRKYLENADNISDISHHGLSLEAVYQFQEGGGDMMDMPIAGKEQSRNDRVPDSTLSRYRLFMQNWSVL